MGIGGIFEIGRSAIYTSKRALDVVAHNVANASTPGFTRQEPVLATVPVGTIIGKNTPGRGVMLSDIRRMYDAFTDLQLRNEKSNFAYWDVVRTTYARLENVFNEASETGMANAIADFFGAWQELTQNPEGYAQRSMVINAGQVLALRMSDSFRALDDERNNLYLDARTMVDEVNKLAAQIADMNEKISMSPGSADLKDKRELLIQQLNDIIKVTTFDDSNQRTTLLFGGSLLVDGGNYYKLNISDAVFNGQNPYAKMSFTINSASGEIPPGMIITKKDVPISDFIGGKLKAVIEIRDNYIIDYQTRLNAIAINLADSVNAIHREGFDFKGAKGTDFFGFNSLLVDMQPDSTDVPEATISSFRVVDFQTYQQNATKFYRIDYKNAPAVGYQQEGNSGIYWRVQESQNGTTWTTINPANVSITIDSFNPPNYRELTFNGVKFKIDATQATLAGQSGQFNITQIRTAGLNMTAMQKDPFKIAAGGANKVDVDGLNNKLRVSFDGGNTYTTITFAPGTYTRQELATMLQASLGAGFTVTYNPNTGQNIITNTSGNTLVLDWSHPATTSSAVFGFTSSSIIANNSSASASIVYGGDNSNAKQIANLVSEPIIAGSSTVDFYRTIGDIVGVQSAASITSSKFYSAIVTELQNRREEISGVNLDEEAIKLMQYQKSFQAASKMISIADEMLQMLMGLVGR